MEAPLVQKIDNRKDILLLLLYAPGQTGKFNEAIVGRTRLMKMLFLFKEEALNRFRAGTAITAENFYEYFPWNFGPFSRDVYDDLEFFLLRGFIEVQESEEETIPESAEEWEQWQSLSRADSSTVPLSEYEEQVFRLTPKGEKFASGLFLGLSAQQQNLLREFKARLAATSLRALLRYVYDNYGSMTSRSKIRDKILPERGRG